MFRRLRARLDGLEARGHQTANNADELIALAKDLLLDIRDDIKDGIEIELTIGERELPIPVKARIKL